MAISPASLGQLLEVFERNFQDRGELGASVSVWWQGQELLCEGRGWCEREKQRPWNAQTLVPVYSATKVPASAALLMALESRGLDSETPVREVWPAFPVPEARFVHLLSHRCGLAALDRKVDLFDHAAVVSAIEAQQPAWRLEDGHGYHPRTFGALLDEPVRRLSGMSLGRYWRQRIAEPLGLQFWIGLPESEWSRVATLYPGKVIKGGEADAFYQQLSNASSYTHRAFFSPSGLHSIHEMNHSRAWSAGLPAMGGVGTASALAKFYQAALGAIPSPLSQKLREALATPVSRAEDRVLLRPTVFSCGAQLDPLTHDGQKARFIFGSSRLAFGHPGAGGSHAMADPQSGISFAYTMNQMSLSVMPGSRCLEMIDAIFPAEN